MASMSFTSQTQPYSDTSLNGGLNNTAGFLSLGDHESSDLQNVDFDKFGSVLKRNGYTPLNTSPLAGAPEGDGLYWFEYNNSGTTVRHAIKIAGGKMYKMDDLDGTWDDITGAVTITAGNQCDFETFVNKVFVTNGEDIPFQWAGSSDATNLTLPTGLTKAKFIKQYNNYLFLANVTVSGVSYPSRIYWSSIQDPTTWDDADFIEVSMDDGQPITGLQVLSDRLVIYKERQIFNLFFTGDANIPFILPQGGKSNSSVGCVAGDSIESVENGQVFLSYDGLYYYDGTNSYKLTDKINNTFINDLNTTKFSQATAINYKNKHKYVLFIASAGQNNNDTGIVLDYFNKSISIYKGIEASDCAIFFVDGINERPYFSDYDGYTYRMDFGSDDYPLNTRTAINAYYSTNWKHFKDINNQKGIPQAVIYYQNNNSVLTFSYSYDFETTDQYTQTFSMSKGTAVYGTAIYGTDVYAGAGGDFSRRDLDGRGRVIRFKFANNTLGETFRIDGFGTMPYAETNV